VTCKCAVGAEAFAQVTELRLVWAVADQCERLLDGCRGTNERADAFEVLVESTAIDEARADRAICAETIEIDEIGNMNELLAPPPPMHQFLQNKPARHNEAADIGLIKRSSR
jgi:hypothetical protein